MNRGIYATATGMTAMQAWMDVVTNNLANAGTTGFKRDTVAFSDVLVRELRSDMGAGSRIGVLGGGSSPCRQSTVFDPGAISSTSNPFDLAIDTPRGLFAIESPEGHRSYTRDGSFQLDGENRLVSKDGGRVLDRDGNPIQLPAGAVKIDEDGTISVNDAPIARIGVWDGRFTKLGLNRFASADAAPIDSNIRSGALEGSNVNSVEAMIEMIKLNRIFELSQKSIQQQDELTGQLIQSLRNQ